MVSHLREPLRLTITNDQSTQTPEEPVRHTDPAELEDNLPIPAVTGPPSPPPITDEDYRIRGTESGTPERQPEKELDPKPTPPHQTTCGHETPIPTKWSFPDTMYELEYRIDELKDDI